MTQLEKRTTMFKIAQAIAVALPAIVLVAGCGPDGATSDGCFDHMKPGDLVITEVFADSTGADEGNEWFEIYNASNRPLNLEGLTLIHSRGDGGMRHQTHLDAVTIAEGDYLVVGNVLPEFRSAWVDVGYADELGDLYNTGSGRIALSCGATEVDTSVYANVKSGESRQLDGGQPPDFTANDDPTTWCRPPRDTAHEFSSGNFGTPGAPNDDCEVIVQGMCEDGDALRPTVAPAAGDLVITEVMPNPSAVSDTVGEWFEVQVHRDVDLNGLTLDRVGDSANGDVISAEKCLHATAGTFLVFARTVDPGSNGGLARVDGTFKFSMVSGSSTAPGDVALVSGTTLIDAFSWTRSRAGKSLQVDPNFANATDNDDLGHWCDGSETYGEGDLGTPGAANAECSGGPAPGTCLDAGVPRAIVKPSTGQLVITEFLANPSGTTDSVREWFEITNVGSVAFDLNELGLARPGLTANVISSTTCKSVAPGGFALFARSADPALNGMLPTVDATFSFSLVDSDGSVEVRDGTTVLDTITWTSVSSGASKQLDPDLFTTVDNDITANFCNGSSPYGDLSNSGTPGAGNTQCP